MYIYIYIFVCFSVFPMLALINWTLPYIYIYIYIGYRLCRRPLPRLDAQIPDIIGFVFG